MNADRITIASLYRDVPTLVRYSTKITTGPSSPHVRTLCVEFENVTTLKKCSLISHYCTHHTHTLTHTPTHTQLPRQSKHLLPRRKVGDERKKCVVIDLDETLVHSSFKVRQGCCTVLCCYGQLMRFI